MKYTIHHLFTLLFIVSLASIKNVSAQQINFDIQKIPFSYRGSYFVISKIDSLPSWSIKEPAKGIFIRNISHRNWFEKMIKVEILNGNQVQEPEIIATPATLILKTLKGNVEFCFENENVLRIKAQGVRLRLSPRQSSFIIPINKQQLRMMDGPNGFLWMVTSLKGNLISSGDTTNKIRPNDLTNFTMDFYPNSMGTIEAAVEECFSEWSPKPYSSSFEFCVEKSKKTFQDWLTSFPGVTEPYKKAQQIAAYQDWSALVAPRGVMTTEGMLMSKNWMNEIWSWDHCFNAIALSKSHPDIAWEQMMCIFRHQSNIGSLPDSYDDERELWGILKTPIHGWALKQMMAAGIVNVKRMKEIYPKLSAWTNFWFKYRDPDGNRIPQYNHSFESFDDTPPFDAGLPVEGPELTSFLIVQMDVLADLAQKLNKPADAKNWKKRSDETLDKMLKVLWNGDAFISKNVSNGNWIKDGHSFIAYVPLILGKKIPEAIRIKLLAELKKEKGLLTNYGFATEALSSKYFNTNSYTRGSIWAPVNHILINGIAASGDETFAKAVAKTFCDNMVQNGFPEKFNALTGSPESDPAYTWTSSVFLILIHQFLSN